MMSVVKKIENTLFKINNKLVKTFLHENRCVDKKNIVAGLFYLIILLLWIFMLAVLFVLFIGILFQTILLTPWWGLLLICLFFYGTIKN